MKKIIGILTIFFSFMTLPMMACNEEEMTDNRDGYVYKTVKIGNQVWMAENLRYDGVNHYSANDDSNNDEQYGYLYTWENAVEACPKGWRLPTKEEFDKLLSTTGAGKDSSSIRDTSWSSGSNSSGFGALPAGFRWYSGDFYYFGSRAYFWSASPGGDGARAYNFYVNSDGARVDLSYCFNALSVRCLKDSN